MPTSSTLRFSKKSVLVLAVALGAGAAAYAAEPSGDVALRAECAAAHAPSGTAAADAHVFVYHQGQLRGEQQPGQSLPCSDKQYQAFVARLDPARVLALNPTAAGAKPAVDEHVFSYKKGVLKQQ